MKSVIYMKYVNYMKSMIYMKYVNNVKLPPTSAFAVAGGSRFIGLCKVGYSTLCSYASLHLVRLWIIPQQACRPFQSG